MTSSPGTEDAAMLAAGVLKRIETENIRNVRLILTDLYGVARGKVVTAARMKRAVTEGHPFAIPLFASNLWQRHAPGEHLYSNDIGYRNGVLRLDPLTFAPLPWTPATAHIVTDLYDDAGQIVATPRAVLRRVLDDARSLGLKPMLDREEPEIFPIYEKLVAATAKRGQFAGIHNATGAYAARMIAMGFRFVTLANDSGLMARAARAEIAITRKNAGDVAS